MMDLDNPLRVKNTFIIEGPQPGAQEKFCASNADIAIGGGAFFGGKSVALCMMAGGNIDNEYYNGVIFRRTYPEIVAGGGLWDIARRLYPQYNGVPTENDLTYTFPAGSKVKFSHLQHEKDLDSHLSAAYAFLGFDQLEEFNQKMFFFLYARNRPPPGYLWRCRCRGTCNPRPGWLADLLGWWWNSNTGYPIKSRSGVIRYFTRIRDKIVWVSKDWRGEGGIKPISITFVPSTLKDNPIGMAADPNYASKVAIMDHIEMERNLKGNWKISYAGGTFDPAWFKKIKLSEVPKKIRKMRYWDFAATKKEEGKDPAWTSGTLGGYADGDFYIIHVARFRENPGVTEEKMKKRAVEHDGRDVAIRWEEEKGSAGRFNSYNLSKMLIGFDAQADPVSGDKIERAKPLAAAAYNGHVFLVEGDWNDDFLAEIGEFPLPSAKKDQVDSTSGCFNCLCIENRVWPSFSAGQTVKFSINWEETSKTNLHYGALYQTRDMSVYFMAALWDDRKAILWIYAAKKWETIIPDIIAKDVINIMKLKRVVVTRLIGNEEMFAGTGRTTAKLLRQSLKDVMPDNKKDTVNLSQSYLFDVHGSMIYANNLFNDKHIRIHSMLSDVTSQCAGWCFEDEKLKEGFGYCHVLCLIASELKKDLTAEKPKLKIPDYDPMKEEKKENSPYSYQTV